MILFPLFAMLLFDEFYVNVPTFSPVFGLEFLIAFYPFYKLLNTDECAF
jgi:hypothetical protein